MLKYIAIDRILFYSYEAVCLDMQSMNISPLDNPDKSPNEGRHRPQEIYVPLL